MSLPNSLDYKWRKPGEFSERSFLNQKRNLIYFEGINNLISAESEKAVKYCKKTSFFFARKSSSKMERQNPGVKGDIKC